MDQALHSNGAVNGADTPVEGAKGAANGADIHTNGVKN
jgi:hypothetical protein